MAKRFRLSALGLVASLVAGATAFAQAPAAPQEKSAKPAKTAAAAPLPAAEAVARANAWLDAARVMSGRLRSDRTGRDSARRGNLCVPSRQDAVRFAPPQKLEIVADGRSVAVRDRSGNSRTSTSSRRRH